MPGKAASVQGTEKQLDILEEINAICTASVRLVQRAKVILLSLAK